MSTALLKDNVIEQCIGDEMVLLNTDTEDFVALNAVGAVIWASLRKSGSLDQARNDVLAAFDAPEARVTSDLHAFVAQLQNLGVVVSTDEGDR